MLASCGLDMKQEYGGSHHGLCVAGLGVLCVQVSLCRRAQLNGDLQSDKPANAAAMWLLHGITVLNGRLEDRAKG